MNFHLPHTILEPIAYQRVSNWKEFELLYQRTQCHFHLFHAKSNSETPTRAQSEWQKSIDIDFINILRAPSETLDRSGNDIIIGLIIGYNNSNIVDRSGLKVCGSS